MPDAEKKRRLAAPVIVTIFGIVKPIIIYVQTSLVPIRANIL